MLVKTLDFLCYIMDNLNCNMTVFSLSHMYVSIVFHFFYYILLYYILVVSACLLEMSL